MANYKATTTRHILILDGLWPTSSISNALNYVTALTLWIRRVLFTYQKDTTIVYIFYIHKTVVTIIWCCLCVFLSNYLVAAYFFFSAFFYENKRPKRLRFFSSCRCNSDRVVGSRTRNVSITKICYCVLFFQFYQHLFINANQKSHSHSEHRGTEVNLSSCCSPVKCMSKCFSLQVLFFVCSVSYGKCAICIY